MALRRLHQIRHAAVRWLRLRSDRLSLILHCFSHIIQHRLRSQSWRETRLQLIHQHNPLLQARTCHPPREQSLHITLNPLRRYYEAVVISRSTQLPHADSITGDEDTVGVKGVAWEVRLFFTDWGTNGAASFTFCAMSRIANLPTVSEVSFGVPVGGDNPPPDWLLVLGLLFI